MIGYLEGTLTEIGNKSVVLVASGVGYIIFTTAKTLESLGKKKGSKLSFHTHLAVREDALDLYGFLDKSELDLFELLLTVSGIGPKSAIAIMNAASPDTITTAVAREDASYLTKVYGIGKKTAEKIVRELEGKLTSAEELTGDLNVEADALEGLQSLGYSEREAREALKKIPESISGTGARITEALRLLNKK